MRATALSIPVFSVRRIETPYERRQGYRNYLLVVDARNLPDLKKWRKINVRDPKGRGRVPKAIRDAFQSKPQEFFFMNRGLVLAAERLEFNDSDQQKIAKVFLRDPEIHGLLDGGHTYRVVSESVGGLDDSDPSRYVRVEVITGFDRDTISDVVEARNTSNQVKDESLANLREEFEPIKRIVQDYPYADSIAWSEYEELDDKPKPIDVRDVISYLVAFDTGSYNSTSQPLIAYKDKRACLRHFQQYRTRMQALYPLLPDFLRIWDEIHLNWPNWYKEGREDEAGIIARFLKLKGVSKLPEYLHFIDQKVQYRMPEAYKYPILSALRAAVKVRNRKASWAADPTELLGEAGPKLANVVGSAIRATDNPNKVGKDVGIWSSCYLVVESALRGSMSAEAHKKIQELEAELAALKRQK